MMFWCRDLFFAETKSFIRQNFCILKNAFCFGLEPATQCGYLNRVIDISEYKKEGLIVFPNQITLHFQSGIEEFTLKLYVSFFQLFITFSITKSQIVTRHIRWLERFVKVPPILFYFVQVIFNQIDRQFLLPTSISCNM